MNLQHIDIRTQPLDTRLDRIKNMLPRQPHLIHKLPIVNAVLGRIPFASRRSRRINAEETFGENDQFRAWDFVLADGFADDFFGAAEGVDVGLFWGSTLVWNEKKKKK